MRKKVIVIGGGPAGYVAAIRAAQLGAEVDLVEKAALGGTCLQVGCIPTKVLLHIGAFYHKATTSAVPGVKSSATLDWPSALAHKESVIQQLTLGVSWLLQNNQIRVHSGAATLLPGASGLDVQVGDRMLSGDAVILAVGSVPAMPSFPGSDLPSVIDSTTALSLEKPPKSILIVGGGVIGIEFATLFAQLGTEVSVVEMMPKMLPALDEEIADFLQKKLEGDGVRLFANARLDKVETDGRICSAWVTTAGGQQTIQVENVLVAVGRRPNTADLGLEALGIAMDRGAVAVDEDYQTTLSGVYAVGDCNGKLMLAHAAMAQGIAAVEHIMGVAKARKENIPACVYSSPEIATVGFTEQALLEKGIPYTVGRFSLAGNGKALIEGADGFIKILADTTYGEVLGVHMIGPKVTEMISEASLCMNMEGTVEDIVSAVHAHPSVSESVWEAAMAVFGKAIHGA